METSIQEGFFREMQTPWTEGIHGKERRDFEDFLRGDTNSKGGFFDGQKGAQEGEKGDWQMH